MSQLNKKILAAILFIFVFLFAFSLFKNISYPLLWNDESETAMFAERILKFGYPKIHDGKNMVYHFKTPVAMNKKLDANLHPGWVQYYYAAIGAYFAARTDNLYVRTALLRIPFAFIGFLGLIIYALTISKIFKDDMERLIFLILFALMELISVPLILHLREVRYYSPAIFLSACIFYFYLNQTFFKKMNIGLYIFCMILSLFLLFNAYYPICLIFIAAIFLYELIKFKIRDFVSAVSPLIISLVIAVPLYRFFNILEVSATFAKRVNFTVHTYFNHILIVLEFFVKYNFLYAALLLKLMILFFFVYFMKNKIPFPADKKMQISNFLSLFFVIYTVLIAVSPYFFERYFIPLQPILAAIILLDCFLIFELAGKHAGSIPQILIWGAFLFLLASSFPNIPYTLKEHCYELFHQYKGPLDFVIPYIRSNYKNPENLVIAVNYEETSYMYYLKCKTIVGSALNNIDEDVKINPDILIYRKGWDLHRRIFENYLQRGRYNKLSFPVVDYYVNNIPDMEGVITHQFRTRLASADAEQLEIYVNPALHCPMAAK